MDALKFIEERNRMCDYYTKEDGAEGCANCSECDSVCNVVRYVTPEYISDVEKWSQEHPRKTRQSVFMAHYPDAALDAGVLRVCPRNVYKSAELNCNATACYLCKSAFWMQEVE